MVNRYFKKKKILL